MTQSLQNTVDAVLSQAKKEQWSFPCVFNALKEAGITSYHVSFAEAPFIVYKSDNDAWKNETPSDIPHCVIGDIFSKECIEKAIKKHQQGLTNYSEWVQEVTAFGVSFYEVCMKDRTVTYFSKKGKDGDHHVEMVP